MVNTSIPLVKTTQKLAYDYYIMTIIIFLFQQKNIELFIHSFTLINALTISNIFNVRLNSMKEIFFLVKKQTHVLYTFSNQLRK